MKKIVRICTLAGILLGFLLTCESPITYKLQNVKGPVAALAEDMNSYTHLTFFTLNKQTDFLKYQISSGATQAEAEAFASPQDCEILDKTGEPLNADQDTKPTRVQLGGTTTRSGMDCFISAIGPLTPGTWVSVRTVRDCTGYVAAVGCESIQYSDISSTEVFDYIEPLTTATITDDTDPATNEVYYTITVTMATIPVNFTGIGLFYSYKAEEAQYKAARNGAIRDGFCALTSADVTAGADIVIQIGGTPLANNCYIDNFYVNTGDVIALRNSVGRMEYPWSSFRTVTVP